MDQCVTTSNLQAIYNLTTKTWTDGLAPAAFHLGVFGTNEGFSERCRPCSFSKWICSIHFMFLYFTLRLIKFSCPHILMFFTSWILNLNAILPRQFSKRSKRDLWMWQNQVAWNLLGHLPTVQPQITWFYVRSTQNNRLPQRHILQSEWQFNRRQHRTMVSFWKTEMYRLNHRGIEAKPRCRVV